MSTVAALGYDPASWLRTRTHLHPGDLRSAASAAAAMDAARRGASPEIVPPDDGASA